VKTDNSNLAVCGSPVAEARVLRVLGVLSAAKFVPILLTLAAAAGVALGQGSFVPEGSEYGITGPLLGEQVQPKASIKPSGGYLVWRDNITDGDGYGISARKLDSSLSGALSVFRVNQVGENDQEFPAVAVLNDGGAAFVWQGGKQGFQHIYGRFLAAAGTWVTADLAVSAATNVYQSEVAIATLTNGNVVATWSSFNQASATSMRDVYLQILTPTGAKFGGETLVNTAINYNQRSASVAALADGRFVVVWVSEQERFENSVDVKARVFSATGSPAGSEILVNSGTNVCSNPSVAPSVDGGFAVSWAERDAVNPTLRWEIRARFFNSAGFGGAVRAVNTHTQGDQFRPVIAGQNNEYIVTWSSVGQDGSREGVYGQFLAGDGSLAGAEFRINGTTVSQQIHPTVASDGVARFLAVWSSYVGGTGVFDLYAQRYVSTSQPLAAPGAPMVNVLSSNVLSVSWPPVSGFSIAHYEVYADGSAMVTATVTNTYWNHTGLAAASTHSYRLAYVLADGRRSPLSVASTNTTYTGGATWGGIPQEWMLGYFGGDIFAWPAPYADTDGDGVSNKDEFFQGTDPTDANSVLKAQLQASSQGLFLNWNTEAGLMYQVWSTASPGGTWSKVGSPRFAAGAVDSLYVGGNPAGFYRIERLR
jgi:hypothetical protein